MKILDVIGFLVLAIFLAIPVSSSGMAASGASGECDVKCQQRKALLGDAVVARTLAEHYLKIDRKIMLHWYLIAAENGDLDSQYNYAHFLAIDSRNSDDCFRAIFWFGVAAKRGHSPSSSRKRKLVEGLEKGDGYQNGCLKQMLRAD